MICLGIKMISSALFFNKNEYIFQRQQNCTACGASVLCSLWKLQVGEGGGSSFAPRIFGQNFITLSSA